LDAHKNFSVSTVATAPSPATSGTSLVVTAGAGALFPTVPFNATVWPVGAQPTAANAEIVRVTNIATDTFTITRAQESSSARTVIVGDQIAATITVKALTDVESAIPAFATNAVVLGSAAVAGAASTVMRSNDTIAAFDATVPSTQAFGDAAAVGTAAFAARRDHKHAMPAAPAPLFATKSGAYTTTPYSNIGTNNPGVGYIVVTPYIVPAAFTAIRLGLKVTGASASGGLIRLGIYNDNGSMVPSTVLVDGGTIDATSATYQEVTISQALSPGIYWLAALQLVQGGTYQAHTTTIPMPITSTQAASQISGYADNGGNSGALPTFPGITYYQVALAVPHILVKA
jgi:hypothetical protein